VLDYKGGKMKMMEREYDSKKGSGRRYTGGRERGAITTMEGRGSVIIYNENEGARI